ncbi:hypothetical protein AGMMS49938_11820 [Fibrobacterales bacterium]|nr:hypothetical protein AGMMS49938_11820 [Fibrobacterales bacterium]
MTLEPKRINGRYFTITNPFMNEGFFEWANACKIKDATILEPFAGANNLISMLQDMQLCKNFISFDIEPQNSKVKKRDTLADFPQGYEVCVTNPPYLAQNSATRRGLPYLHTEYDDLYKFALSKCLENCTNVAAIIPASFLNSYLFRNRLSHYILLSSKMFNDTEHPVCLALFNRESEKVKIYDGENYIGLLNELEAKLPSTNKETNMKFNDKNGNLGLIAIDNTLEPSIKFVKGNTINPNRIGISSRSITRISVDTDAEKLIPKINDRLNNFRKDTYDLFLTPFKGLRRDNKFRRRLDFSLARKLINEIAV